MQNGSSVGICRYTLHTRFGTFGADLYAQSVLGDKISASELTRKLIKSAMLVGQGNLCHREKGEGKAMHHSCRLCSGADNNKRFWKKEKGWQYCFLGGGRRKGVEQ